MAGFIFWLVGAILSVLVSYYAFYLRGSWRSLEIIVVITAWIMFAVVTALSWFGLLIQLSMIYEEYLLIHRTNSQETEIQSWRNIYRRYVLHDESYSWDHLKLKN